MTRLGHVNMSDMNVRDVNRRVLMNDHNRSAVVMRGAVTCAQPQHQSNTGNGKGDLGTQVLLLNRLEGPRYRGVEEAVKLFLRDEVLHQQSPQTILVHMVHCVNCYFERCITQQEL